MVHKIYTKAPDREKYVWVGVVCSDEGRAAYTDAYLTNSFSVSALAFVVGFQAKMLHDNLNSLLFYELLYKVGIKSPA